LPSKDVGEKDLERPSHPRGDQSEKKMRREEGDGMSDLGDILGAGQKTVKGVQ